MCGPCTNLHDAGKPRCAQPHTCLYNPKAHTHTHTHIYIYIYRWVKVNALKKGDRPQGCNTVFVGGLAFEIDEERLREHFGSCGAISAIRWGEDKQTGDFKGYAHIVFDQDDAVDAAVALSGSELLGRSIRVDYATDVRNNNNNRDDNKRQNDRGVAGKVCVCVCVVSVSMRLSLSLIVRVHVHVLIYVTIQHSHAVSGQKVIENKRRMHTLLHLIPSKREHQFLGDEARNST